MLQAFKSTGPSLVDSLQHTTVLGSVDFKWFANVAAAVRNGKIVGELLDVPHRQSRSCLLARSCSAAQVPPLWIHPDLCYLHCMVKVRPPCPLTPHVTVTLNGKPLAPGPSKDIPWGSVAFSPEQVRRP